MTRTKDAFLEQMEDSEMQERVEHENYQQELSELHQLIPPIDLGLMNPSIATSEQLANGIISAIIEGRISPLEFAVKKKCLELALDMAFNDRSVKDLCIEEVSKHGKDGASMYGASLKISNSAKYEYEKDPTWNKINEDMVPLLAAKKAQEERIKNACKMNGSIVSEDGEELARVVPCSKSETVAVSFKTKK